MFVPHYAMSGGTLIALAADEIVMSPHAVLGPVDPQLGQHSAASILAVVRDKPIPEIDDQTLMWADQARKAIEQVRALVAERPEIWRYRRGVVEALRGQANAGDAPAQRLQQALDLVATSKDAGILPDAEAWLADDLREALAEAK